MPILPRAMLGLGLTLTALLAGCQSFQSGDGRRTAEAAPPPPIETIDGDSAAGDDAALPAELNSARAAAMVVATLPPVNDAPTRVEIALHAALYRAAWESNIADITSHYLLEPARELRERPELAVSERSFRLRVLAALAEVGEPIAWTWKPATGAMEYFPSTRESATRLSVRIISRDPEQATVIAEVGDWTAHVGATRQRVTAVWDGAEWILQRDPARLIW